MLCRNFALQPRAAVPYKNDMRRTSVHPHRVMLCAGLVATAISLLSMPASAVCTEEPAPASENVLWKHLGKDCSDQERVRRVVTGQEILAALKAGKGIDLAGVVVTDDVILDAVPAQPVEKLAGFSQSELDAIRSLDVGEVRVLAGALSIRDSNVKGTIATKLRGGYLVIHGPVMLTGTTFERLVDFSRTLFLGPVDGSNAIFLREAFFIGGRFPQPVRFAKTAFGPHSRFHRAHFHDSVNFQQAGFNGLSEFLEVTFDKDVNLSRTYFKQGTGFSGARFRALLDFSEAVFDREAFFTFTVFEADAYFRRATFRSVADFSDAEFKGVDDFAKVLFEQTPRFARVKRPAEGARPHGLQNPNIQLAITLSLLLFSALLVVYLIKAR